MSKDVVAFCMQISIKRSKPSAEKIDILTRPSRDLENCLDLAIRKGKALGESKPTENANEKRQNRT